MFHTGIKREIAPAGVILGGMSMAKEIIDEFDHQTAEIVLSDAVESGMLTYYGTRYVVSKLPLLPNYVDTWIQTYLESSEYLTDLMNEFAPPTGTLTPEFQKVYNWYLDNPEDFLRAVSTDYGVIQEKEYEVRILIDDTDSYLLKDLTTGKYEIGSKEVHPDVITQYQSRFTEEDIRSLKNGDVLFERFAYLVKE